MTQTMVLKAYFGLLPGQTLTEFAAELKALSDAEKAELAAGAALLLGVTIKVAA